MNVYLYSYCEMAPPAFARLGGTGRCSSAVPGVAAVGEMAALLSRLVRFSSTDTDRNHFFEAGCYGGSLTEVVLLT